MSAAAKCASVISVGWHAALRRANVTFVALRGAARAKICRAAHLRFEARISDAKGRSHNPKEVIPCLVRILGFQ